MSRYWVNLGNWDSASSGIDIYDKVKVELLNLDSRVMPTTNGLVFKTNDLEEAKAIGSKARYIIRKHLGEDVDLFMVSITRQPECPKCGKLGRFSDFHCGSCGSELTPKEYYDVEDVEVEKIKFT